MSSSTNRNSLGPVSRTALVGWILGYAVFLLYAAANTTGFLFVDNANLMFHEAGHVLFSWAGYYTQILGGTLGQLLVPIACTIVFIRRGETTAAVVRGLDWTGMIATMAWLVWRHLLSGVSSSDATRA